MTDTMHGALLATVSLLLLFFSFLMGQAAERQKYEVVRYLVPVYGQKDTTRAIDTQILTCRQPKEER